MQAVQTAGGRVALYDQRAMLREHDESDLRIRSRQRESDHLLWGNRGHVLDGGKLLPALLVCLRVLPHVGTGQVGVGESVSRRLDG